MAEGNGVSMKTITGTGRVASGGGSCTNGEPGRESGDTSPTEDGFRRQLEVVHPGDVPEVAVAISLMLEHKLRNVGIGTSNV